jgi:SAM-dependent methyltransferase
MQEAVGSLPDGPLEPDTLSRLYRERFAEDDTAFKEEVWRILCEQIFQPHVKGDDTVLDLGAGRCEFINAIRCGSKIAVDLNPDVVNHAREARVVQASSTDMKDVATSSVDVIFSSNFLEHLPDKRSVLRTLAECNRLLRPEGTLIILMPNIRYLHGRYWDYFDHHTPLSHYSLTEALSLTGFDPIRVVPRFLPYTVKQRSIPRSTLLVRVYLSLPFLWQLFGRQMLVIARRSSSLSDAGP